MNTENIKNKEERIVKEMIDMICGSAYISPEAMSSMVAVVKKNNWVEEVGFERTIGEGSYEVRRNNITDEMLDIIEPIFDAH